MDTKSAHEIAGRAIKTLALSGAVMVLASLDGDDVLSEGFVEKLKRSGSNYWQRVCAASGAKEPSRETKDALIVFFAASAAKAKSLRPAPTQPGAEA